MEFVEPCINRVADFIELAGEEVVGGFDYDELFWRRKRVEEHFDVWKRAEFIAAALDDQLWFCAVAQVRQVRSINGKSQAD